MNNEYIIGSKETRTGRIDIVSTKLNFRDKIGAIRVRWGIKRNKYRVTPGIYAAGNPGNNSPVFVTANYKLSFDSLRKNLAGIDCWIIVLDTKGINVWCSAGKGTFGTEELTNRIRSTGIDKLITHKKIIIPQLGAVGVSGYKIRKDTGFTVIFGPVRAADLPAFLKAGMKATPLMRQVSFTLYDRIVLVPMEMMIVLKYMIIAIICLFILSGLNRSGYSFNLAIRMGINSSISLAFAYIAGTILGPVFLPWIPGKSFSIKGFITGLIAFCLLMYFGIIGNSLIEILSWLFITTTISSHLTLNFTGASTYTSLSGVKKEMRIALPVQISGFIIGSILWIIGRFI